MINYLIKKLGLSKNGVKGLIGSSIFCTLDDIILMLPVMILYFLVDELLHDGIASQHIWMYVVSMIGVLILIGIVMLFQYNACFFSTYKESGVRRIALAEKIRKLPLSFFGKRDLSDLTTVMMNDCATLETMYSHWFPELIGAIISTVLISIGLFFYDWRLALAALWPLPIALLIVCLSGKIQNKMTAKTQLFKRECDEGIQEELEAMKDLRSSNAEEKYTKNLDKKFHKYMNQNIKSELITGIFCTSGSLVLKFGIPTVALVGGALLLNNDLPLITFFMFLLVVARLYDPLSISLQQLSAIISARVNNARIKDIMLHDVQTGSDDTSINKYDIEFKDVSFSYSENEAVINDVSFIAKQGEVTALIGPSGGGKSTISKLAARFYDIDQGTIFLGGNDISKIDPEYLLKYYSIVFQDVTLFNNSVLENIRIGRKDATDEEVIQAAKEAECESFVKKLPNGYLTMIGENGCRLSGGERQRISIARALLKNAPIILLDEATASLDAENETKIQKAISRLIRNKTVLIIAHRMRTIEDADKIVVLKDGHIYEEGTPNKLLEKNGLFAHMVKLQKESNCWRI